MSFEAESNEEFERPHDPDLDLKLDAQAESGPAAKRMPIRDRIWNRTFRIRWINAAAIVLAAFLAIVALGTMRQIYDIKAEADESQKAYAECSTAASELQSASDYLTIESRMYVLTGLRSHLDDYLAEYTDVDRRGNAVRRIESAVGDVPALDNVEQALSLSNLLVKRELYAMRLRAESLAVEDMPLELASVELGVHDASLEPEGKYQVAYKIMTGSGYHEAKQRIDESVQDYLAELIDDFQQLSEQDNLRVKGLLDQMHVIVMALLVLILLSTFTTIFFVLWPSALYARQINRDEKLRLVGAYELKHIVEAYNSAREENRRRTTKLQRDATRDPLTGLYNRGVFDSLIGEQSQETALLLIDVDNFKGCNDTHGHDIGDLVLKKVAGAISDSFRSSDHACRVGGDEFAVIMTRVNPSMSEAVARKVAMMAEKLGDVSDGLPPVTLSVGIAFMEDATEAKGLYRCADQALYEVKGRGRNGYAFYGKD